MCCIVHVPDLKSLSNIAFLPTKYLCSVDHKNGCHNNFYYIADTAVHYLRTVLQTLTGMYIRMRKASTPACAGASNVNGAHKHACM